MTSTAIAALKLKRHFIGYEILPEYVELANKRIANFKEQLKIDDFFNVDRFYRSRKWRKSLNMRNPLF